MGQTEGGELPLSGAALSLSWERDPKDKNHESENRLAKEARTDGDGFATFGGVTCGAGSLRAMAPGFLGAEIEVTRPDPTGASEVLISLRPLSSIIGRVVRRSGEPVASAKVSVEYAKQVAPLAPLLDGKVRRQCLRPTATTDGRGEFQLPAVLPDQPLKLVVTSEGSGRLRQDQVPLAGGENRSVSLELPGSTIVKGIVHGTPAPSTQSLIQLWETSEDMRGLRAEKNRQGVADRAFVFQDVSPGRKLLTAFNSNENSIDFSSVLTRVEAERTVDVGELRVLGTSVSLDIDIEGRGAEDPPVLVNLDVAVVVPVQSTGGVMNIPYDFNLPVRDHRVIDLRGLPYGDLRVMAIVRGAGSPFRNPAYREKRVEVKFDGTTASIPVHIELDREAALKGALLVRIAGLPGVQDSDIEPCMTVERNGGVAETIFGCAKGTREFTFRSLKAATYTVSVSANGFSGVSGPITISPKQTSVAEITNWTEASTLEGLLLNSDRSPATKGRIYLMGAGDSDGSRTVVRRIDVDSKGYFCLRGVPKIRDLRIEGISDLDEGVKFPIPTSDPPGFMEVIFNSRVESK